MRHTIVLICPKVTYVFPGSPGSKDPQEMQETRVLSLASGRSLGEGSGNPLHYFCLDSPMDREAWWTIVHVVTMN